MPNYQTNDNMLYIVNDARSIELQITDITEAWLSSEQAPQILRLEEERQAALRKWHYEAGFDIAGKKGNSDEFGLALAFAAKLTGNNDTFLFYGSIEQADRDSIDSSDETIIGAEYTAYQMIPEAGMYVQNSRKMTSKISFNVPYSMPDSISTTKFRRTLAWITLWFWLLPWKI